MGRRRLALLVGVLVLALIGGASYVVVARQHRPVRHPVATPSPPPVLVPVGAHHQARAQRPIPTPAGLAAALRRPLSSPALRSTAVVVSDVVTGRDLYAAHADELRRPASTAKLSTAIAALSVLGPADRIATTTVLAGRTAPKGRRRHLDTVVLVGGGDPTVSEHDLDKLAARTAAALRRRGRTSVTLGYDLSAYAGPTTAPGWKPTYVTEGDIAPVVALEVDEGRQTPHQRPRYSHPARAAADAFAAALRHDGVTVTGDAGERTAPAAATRIARVLSAPVGKLVQRMLRRSDNALAEALIRGIARRLGKPPSFAGGAAAVRETLARLDVDTSGLRLVDGSGLSRRDRVRASTLADLLELAASAAHPRLRLVVGGLPVAGFTGTLTDRFGRPPQRLAAGDVRAKTGTLEGVSALAGFTVDRDGRLLAFVLLAERPGVPEPAEAALDRAATALAQCGCR
jgi:D-alanyl-D-alanine carboxypeptidase/D-alanyl-D-alanine-endopeptidase (penicillin-binding protein 4)